MATSFYAHSLEGRPVEEWQGLEDHLRQTAEMAGEFAGAFGPDWGRLAGLWHDAGKYRRAFQIRIGVDPEAHCSENVDHSTVGALIAKERGAPLLSFVVAGHHGGIPNGGDLASRLTGKAELLAEARRDGLPAGLEKESVPPVPGWVAGLKDKASLALWVRMVFSALVDADYLDTEKFMREGRDLGLRPSLVQLRDRLEEYMARKVGGAPATPVNAMRARVLDACRRAAAEAQGMYTLTVPTGGGKTLASLMFALEHAVKHGLERVIVVIPYTSIIEQTAKTYREALGQDAVLEHHTNVDVEKETPASRLACENWDAPLIVTTNVQFFESLYGNRPAQCRKLHRIPGSVVIFDEVQTFPVDLLPPVKNVLRELAERYRTTMVFCTATQPVLFKSAREIVPDREAEFAVVANRCEVVMPAQTSEPVTWEGLAEELRGHERVMAIVHRRDDAQTLAALVGEDCLHLSARMCAAHRSEVLGEVKGRLQAGEDCRLVATQLVEAGVDVDFPVVYRAFAGADSLAQAAGRCNREGKGRGELHVFVAPTKPPRGVLRTAQERAREMWVEGTLDLTRPATFVEFFRRLYRAAEEDTRGIMASERELAFLDVAEKFRMIEQVGEHVVAPYGDWQGRVEEVRSFGISRERMRPLQRFLVTLYSAEIQELRRAGAIERIADSFWAVVPSFRVYSSRWGFGWRGVLAAEPEDLIA